MKLWPFIFVNWRNGVMNCDDKGFWQTFITDGYLIGLRRSLMNIGNQIAGLRKNHHFSQDDFALKIHVSRQTVSNWETNKTYPDIGTLVMIADFFELSLDELVREDVPIMKQKLLANKIKWLGFGFIGILVLTYLCLFVLKYSPMLGSLLVGASTVIGLIFIYQFYKVMNSANLKTFRQVIQYVGNNKVKPQKEKSMFHMTMVYFVSALIGLIAGGIITWLIFQYGLGINLFK